MMDRLQRILSQWFVLPLLVAVLFVLLCLIAGKLRSPGENVQFGDLAANGKQADQTPQNKTTHLPPLLVEVSPPEIVAWEMPIGGPSLATPAPPLRGPAFDGQYATSPVDREIFREAEPNIPPTESGPLILSAQRYLPEDFNPAEEEDLNPAEEDSGLRLRSPSREGWLGQSEAVPQKERSWGFASLSRQPPQLSFETEPSLAEIEETPREPELAYEGPVSPPGLLHVRPDGPARRSEHLEMMAREADSHTRKGFELAGRSAYFSARAEFILALRLVSQALDAEYQTGAHSRALAAGLTALKEAQDFIPGGSRLEADLDVPGIIAGHFTPILKPADATSPAPLDALQCYLTFAQEQLAYAAGNELAGSMALHGLGNLHRVLAEKGNSTIRAAGTKTVVFYQAALMVNPRNYMASNELGVMLAQGGRYEDARTALEHSLSVCQRPEGWQNLAVVFRRLGLADLAQRADRCSRMPPRMDTTRQQSGQMASVGPVQWVPQDVFVGRQPGPVNVAQQSLPSTTDRQAQNPQAKMKIQSKTTFSWPWSF